MEQQTSSQIPAILFRTVIAVVILSAQGAQVRVSSQEVLTDWTDWGAWSSCTRTCGLGVRQRQRQCQERDTYYTANYYRLRNSPVNRGRTLTSNCLGRYKDIQTCNRKACQRGSKGFRAVQCEQFNAKPLRSGRRYRWVPYSKVANQCSLACRAVGHRFYAILASKAKDGTPCGRPPSSDEKGDVTRICVSGECQIVGCDGVIGSSRHLDRCGVCGGDNGSCKIVEGIYANNRLKFGYNKIAQIPAGACHIKITELGNSRNFLALKTRRGKSIINGNWAIDWSGSYGAAGTTFTYQRDRHRSVHPNMGESITARGPLNQTVDLFLLYRKRNPGIKYVYTIPKANLFAKSNAGGLGSDRSLNKVSTNAEEPLTIHKAPVYVSGKDTKQVAALSSGPRYRHGGQASPSQNTYRAYRGRTPAGSQPVRPSYYRGTKRSQQRDQIALNLRNNKRIIGQSLGGSRYSWKVTGFTDCSATCGGGIQNTVVICVKENSQAVVTNENCDNAIRPATQSTPCNTSPCPPAWEATDWSKCSVTCGQGSQTRQVVCKQKISLTVHLSVTARLCGSKFRPADTKACRLKPCTAWKAGKWSKCSAECGKGVKTRTVQCLDTNQAVVADGRCNGQHPARQTTCRSDSCKKVWLHTRWSDKCSTDCGEGVYSRKVFCSADPPNSKGHTSCELSQRPALETSCSSGQRLCGGRWFTGPWSKCTSCNSRQRRTVVCMKETAAGQVTMVADSYCMTEERPRADQPCHTENCHAEWFMSAWSPCSRTCNGGVRQRDIRCVDKDRLPSDTCRISEKPNTKETCARTPCPAEATVAPNCRDRYSNCRLVVQARLCRYSYYKNVCCQSCTLHKLHHRRRRH